MKLIAAAVAAAVALPLAVISGIAMLAGATDEPIIPIGSECTIGDLDGEILTLGYLDEEISNAAVIYSVAIEQGVGEWGAIVGIATAMQESSLRNLRYLGDANDHDSLGLFQQRPSQGWGTPEQLMDPEYAATMFYTRLIEITGWESLPLTVAAQTVQRSAFPDAYARHEPLATILTELLSATVSCAPTADGDWTHPVPGVPVGSGYRSADRPTHDGVDLSTSPSTPILAAGSGEVVTVQCNASYPDGSPYSCDVDGSPSIMGCGWYLEIRHPDDTLTRYCHLQSRPLVNVGEHVRAGQRIGIIGSSGNSSGPHLHFETHASYPAHSGTAIPPLEYMASRGVQL